MPELASPPGEDEPVEARGQDLPLGAAGQGGGGGVWPRGRGLGGGQPTAGQQGGQGPAGAGTAGPANHLYSHVQGHISEALLGHSSNPGEVLHIRSEVKMAEVAGADSVRADFVVGGTVVEGVVEGGTVVEVKSCVCADYHRDTAPPGGKKDRYVTVSSTVEAGEYRRTGLFPIGKRGQDWQGQKVVSARCVKHLRHLAHIAGTNVNIYVQSTLYTLHWRPTSYIRRGKNRSAPPALSCSGDPPYILDFHLIGS